VSMAQASQMNGASHHIKSVLLQFQGRQHTHATKNQGYGVQKGIELQCSQEKNRRLGKQLTVKVLRQPI
ncbi:MAG: hypothetical protein QGI09_11055, partial [Dehalococcoidia bacterium]|nr:hypothetical protein [Dehalococcoidia bacterium]